MIIEVEEAKHNEISMKNYMNMSWAWTHDLLHGFPVTYPLHHNGQLLKGAKETNHNEGIVNCIKEALLSIA